MTSLVETPVADCPSRSELLAFVSGHTSHAESQPIDAHVSSCQRCLDAIERLEDRSDLVVQALAAMPETADDEQEFQRLHDELLSQSTMTDVGRVAARNGSWCDTSQSPPLPSQLGAYELLNEIGRGASGAVFRARHVKLDREFAVKVLHSYRRADAHSAAHFLREMRAVGALNHPHIVRATDAGEDQGFEYLVMEYADGVDVSEIVRRLGALAPADACEIARQAALGLQNAHDHGLVHRDLKPSNLLLTSAGQIKILDLGLVAASPDPALLPEAPWNRFPRGTADYMAPEQWNDFHNVDHRADQYSLGCTLFKMLTGSAPYQSSSVACQSKMRAHVSGKIPQLGAACNAPPQLERLMSRLLAKRPEDRYGSAAELLVDLAPLAAGAELPSLLPRLGLSHEAPATIDTPRPPVATSARRIDRRVMLAGGATAASLAAVYGGRWWRRASRVQTGEWRPLSPVASPLLLSLDDDAQWTNDSAQRAVSITCNDYALVNLGRPVEGAFSFRTAWTTHLPLSRGGIFFRYRQEVRGGEFIRDFHCLELIREADEPSRGILEWSHMLIRRSTAEDRVKRKQWASTLVEVTNETSQLQVTLGLEGFPVVVWNGKLLPESRWKLSSEGRRKSQIPQRRLRTDYLRSLGVLAAHGATFYRPELMYHDAS
jgi:serine/threonine protein kinase